MGSGIMRFGKWKGFRFEEIEASYMVWIYDNSVAKNDSDLWDYLDKNIEALRIEKQDSERYNFNPND